MPRSLSARELEVVERVKQAKSNTEIAEELGISVETVKRHVGNIFEKTGASSRVELATNGPDLRAAVVAFDQLSIIGASGPRPLRWFRPAERKPPINVSVRVLVRTHSEGSLHELEAVYAGGKFTVRIGTEYEDLRSFVLAWTPAPAADLAIRPGRRSLPEATREQVHAVMRRCKGNKRQAARVLGVSRSTLYEWLGQMEDSQ